MKKYTLILLVFISLSAKSQVVNRFRDSTWFAKSVRFDSAIYLIKGASNGKVLTSDAYGRATWQSASGGVSQSALDDSINSVRSIRKVDTLYKNLDSIIYKINGVRYAVKDSVGSGGGSQTLSISNDTLTISGGNSVILPVYIQIDSSTINSYDVLNSQNTPPISPNTGDVYLVGNVPTGAWVGHAKDIAEWNGSEWVFTDGVQGDFLYNATNALTYIFRSGNWVQTTGIPALNNGNTISSGLRIGTNNARSLTFETNNVNRGRFDSIGRFYVYDTSLRKSNKYLQIDSITGRLVASEISGGGGSFIPLSGTEVGKPVTGDIEFYNSGEDITKYLKFNNTTGGFIFGDENEFVSPNQLYLFDGTYFLSIGTVIDRLEIAANNPNSKGIGSASDFTANITDLDYTQKKYVDNAISSNRKVDTSYIFRNATLDSTCMITVINGITYRSCAKDSVGSGTAYTFSTGLTNTAGTVTANLSTGIAGGQSVIGGTAIGENLTLSSTSNATKGKILFGNSTYNELTNKLGIGTTSPTQPIEVTRNTSGGDYPSILIKNTNTSGDSHSAIDLQVNNGAVWSQLLAAGTNTIFGAPGMGFRVITGHPFFIQTNNVTRLTVSAGGNVGIGTLTPVASAKLELSSTTQGFLPPRMTATQASAISTPAQGLLLFVSDTNGTFTSVGWWGYNGSTWEKLNN